MVPSLRMRSGDRLRSCSMLPETERVRLESCPTIYGCSEEWSWPLTFEQTKYADAERWYGHVVGRFANTHFAAEAMYWLAVSQYSASHDHTVLGKVAEELRSSYPFSFRTRKSIPWQVRLPEPSRSA